MNLRIEDIDGVIFVSGTTNSGKTTKLIEMMSVCSLIESADTCVFVSREINEDIVRRTYYGNPNNMYFLSVDLDEEITFEIILEKFDEQHNIGVSPDYLFLDGFSREDVENVHDGVYISPYYTKIFTTQQLRKSYNE